MAKRTIHWEMRNESQEGFGYKFKSKCEYRWAKYLEQLLTLGAIDSWLYEPTKFEFGERWRVRKQYTPDFLVTEDGLEVYHEVKTALRQTDVTRFRCLAMDYPAVKIVLVIFGPENTRSAKKMRLRANANKYVERTIYANPLLKKWNI